MKSAFVGALCVAAALAISILAACGGGGGASGPPPPAVITSLVPSTATRGGPAFVLTVNGANFLAGAQVQWNGASRPTVFVSASQVTAQVSADDILVAGTENVSVINPAPNASASNAVQFTVPCVLAVAGPASSQTHARLGAYYFDGWTGPLTNFHFNGLLSGPYQGREPLSGWQDNNKCAVEQQLAWAHSFGLGFFVFDWYFNATVLEPPEDLNSALKITHALADRHGMQYAILYVNSPPFVAGPADWAGAIDEWMGYMADPAYMLVNGKPLFHIIDMEQMRQTFGSSTAVSAALNQLRAAGQAHGFAGVYIVGGVGNPGDSFGLAFVDGYDAVSIYNYPGLVGAANGMSPFSSLADTGKSIWSEEALWSPLPFIPVAMTGWDPRPWNGNNLAWFGRSPQEVATFVGDAITWAESTPRLRAEPSPAPPIVLMEAWNEQGEGSFLTPTVGDGTSYGDSLAAMLAGPPTRTRTILTLKDSGPTSPNRTASGALSDATGAPINGAAITLSYTPASGTGTVAQYQLSGQTPAVATQAVVGFRVNYEGAGPGPSDFSLYQASYVQAGDGIERVVNGDFSLGAQSWSLGGLAQLTPSDRGPGQMVRVLATPSQTAALTSAPFAVTPGAAFVVSFTASVAPSSVGSGYLTVIFLNGTEIQRQDIPLTAAKIALGTASPDAAGAYQFSLSVLGTSQAIVEADYAGDPQHWPGYTRVGP
jgi:hypothetical protein